MEQITIAAVGTPSLHETTKGSEVEVTGTTTGKEVSLTTEAGQPNVKMKLVRPIYALAVRFGHLWLKTFFGSLGGDTMSDLIGVNLFGDVAPIKAAALVATSTAVIGFGKDLYTIFQDLETKHPLLTGSI